MADRILIWSCWMPGAFLLWMLWDISRYEGWGQWAAAPMLLLPVFLSLVVTVWGVVRVLTLRRANRLTAAPALATVVASGPLLWLGYRFLVAP